MKFPLIFAPQKVIEDFLFFRVSFHYCPEILEDTFGQEQQTKGYIHGKGALREQKFFNYPWVFFGETGGRVKDFRGSWETACKEAKPEGRLFRDFGRAAVRSRVRAGVIERVVIMISRHKTPSVFERSL